MSTRDLRQWIQDAERLGGELRQIKGADWNLEVGAITELAHWQNQGYALIVPQVKEKVVSIEAIR